jgi:hypothetical protein
LAARKAAHRTAQRRYRQSAKGRRAHCLAENRRRQRINHTALEKMDDQSSTLPPPKCMLALKSAPVLPGAAACCHFCGRWGIVVNKFPRRLYGKRVYLEAYDEKTIFR